MKFRTIVALLGLMVTLHGNADAGFHNGTIGDRQSPAPTVAPSQQHPTNHGAVLYEDKGNVIYPADEGPLAMLKAFFGTLIWGGRQAP